MVNEEINETEIVEMLKGEIHFPKTRIQLYILLDDITYRLSSILDYNISAYDCIKHFNIPIKLIR